MTSAADVIRARLIDGPPDAAIILGSSLDPVSAILEHPRTLDYSELPGFPAPKVSGHAGKVASGRVGPANVLILRGRAHPYESGDPAVMRPVIETLAELGTRALILTNAAGSLDPRMRPGRIMLVSDHINFSGMNPLIGEIGDQGFVPMTDAYDAGLAEKFRAAARAGGIALAEGVYMWFSGPSFETPAEVRLARMARARAVGMSTVPEVILARRFGLRVAALSVITNLAAGLEGASPSHEETKREGEKASADMMRLLRGFFAQA
ncbi:MAG: purine-nucleoside phosphorylase [Hyphomicrobiales bacterium]